MTEKMKNIDLPDGTTIPVLGQGTWQMGDQEKRRTLEIESLRTGIELGMTLIDTAEMYGDGNSERLVGEAIAPYKREDLFLVSKVYPWNAGRDKMEASCRRTLERLNTDYLDLYLLHWPGSVPLEETIECFETLMAKGLIRRWGVSNFDLAHMKSLLDIKGGSHVSTVQNLYHLGSRGVEFDLMPWLMEKHIPLMAYCPLAQAGRLRAALVDSLEVQAIALKRNVTPYQILLAFVLTKPGVLAIPKASTPDHVKENRQAADIHLSEKELAILDMAFPKPDRAVPLDIE
ncbi:MAG TPA: aldo/keto reductase [Fastidiosipila sp.]|nr:aldo/keto reductase [Fastidiosipila sp.]